MGLTTKEIGSSSFNDMISSVDRRSEYVENRAGANVTLNNFLTPYTLDNKSSILNAPCGYSNGMYASLRPVQTIGPELITNGDFATDSNWTKGTGWSIANGKASRTAQSGSTACDQSISLIAGKKYKIVYTLTISAGSFNVRFSGTTNVNGLSRTTSGTYVDYLVAATGNNTFRLVGANGSFVGSIDNVSVKEVTDADFDFTRGSSATRVNEKGLIEDVQVLSGELVQNGDFEEIGSELVTNGDFATDSDWSTEGTPSFSIANGVLNCFSDGAYAGVSQNIVLEQGKTYKLELDIVRIGENSGSLNFGDQTSYILLSFVSSSDDLGKKTIYFKPERTTTIIRIYRSSACDIDLDNVSVKEVGQNWGFGSAWDIENGKALYDGSSNGSLIQQYNILTSGKKYKASFNVLDNSGRFRISVDGGASVYQTYTTGNGYYTFEFTSTSTNFRIGGSMADSVDTFSIDNISVIEITDDTDLPRIDYTDGTGSLLLEPQSTNLVTQSETFSTWWKGFVLLTSTNIVAPDGGTSVIKMSSSNVSSGEHKVKFYPGTNPSTSSIFAKMGEVRYIMNRRHVPGTSWQSVVFDLQEGVVAANNYSSNAYPKITHYGNGWYRCEVYYPNVGHTETGWGLSNGTDHNYTPTNTTDGLYIWGAQQEDLSYATSYIPTEASTVTRSADVANNSGNADLFNDSEGVLYAEIAALADDGTSRTISINNTVSNRVFLQLRATSGQVLSGVVKGGVVQGTVMPYSISQTSNIKLAIKYKQNDFALWVNGIEVGTSSGNVFASDTLNNLSFDSGSGAEDFYGNVKSVAVFKEALTDAELAQITSATQQEVFYEMRDRMLQINADYYEFDDYTTRLKKLF